MQSGSSKFWTWVAIGGLTILLVVGLNIAFGGIKKQFDLTEDKRYTLPDAAEEIAGRLEDVCTVTLYISDPLPQRIAFLPRVLRDRLEEFRVASDDKLIYEFVPPDADEALKAELQKRQPPIVPVQIPDIVEGKYVLGSYFLWAVFRYGKEESTFNLVELQQALADESAVSSLLPFQIAARLVKLMNPATKVGIASEKKVPPPELQQQLGKDANDGLAQLRTSIERHLPKPEDVAIKNGMPVREGVNALIVHRPEKLDERAVFELDQYLMRGNDIILLLDNFALFDMDRVMEWQQGIQSGTMKVRPTEHGLTDWLRHFGVVVEEGYVEDRTHATSVSQMMEAGPGGGLRIRERRRELPGIVLVPELREDKTPSGQFSKDSPALAGLGRVGMALPVPLFVDQEAVKAHGQDGEGNPLVKADTVLRTSPEAWVRKVENGSVTLYFDETNMPTPPDRSEWGSRPLVVAVHGKFKSYFAGKSYGESDRPPRKGPDGKDLPELPSPSPKLEESVEPGQLWVFADSDFASQFGIGMIQNQLLQSQDGALGMQYLQVGLVNVLDTMTVGDELIEIRRPSIVDRSVDPIRIEEDKRSIQWWTVGFAPVLLIGIGILWWVGRAAATRIPSPQGPRREPLVVGPASEADHPAGSEVAETATAAAGEARTSEETKS